ncbi:hypothetical protein Cgig2_016926 [Carnegiea gigantea]|uniref:TF-B3 domain-containing protein n=1 Tax=Carnegiea gigantea TaxID=171969 RepID=A0A9Q1JKX0_9CARY|nr:hypothetical protein Cgig2_016926 [Carnegiea gigantea]
MMTTRRPHFLEVFLPNSSSQRLSIPMKFVKHLGSQTFGSFSLTGPSGNTWVVKLIEHNDDLLLDDGWPIFVTDHSLECGDSLVFRYDGYSHFTVQIFDQSSCEKEEAFYAKCSQGLSYSGGNLGQKREREREGAFPSVYAEKKTRASWTPVHIDFPDGNNLMKLEMCSHKGPEQKEIMVNGPDNRTREFISTSEKPILLAIPSFANGQPIPTIVNSCCKKNASKVKKTCAKKKKVCIDKTASISKFIERRAAQYFTSNFPYFIRVMKYSNVSDTGTLFEAAMSCCDLLFFFLSVLWSIYLMCLQKIPIDFSKAHLPNCRTKVTLQNLNGDCWTLNSVPTERLHSTMHTFCGGWLAFVRGNGLKLEDICIFELVGRFEMRVRILRLGLEGLSRQIKKASDGLGELDLRTAGNVPQETRQVRLSKVFEQKNEPSKHGSDLWKETVNTMAGTQEEPAPSIDTIDGGTALESPENSASWAISKADSNRTDKRLECYADETTSYHTSSKNQANFHARHTMQMPLTVEEARAALSFTSPFPNFIKVMMYSNVGGSYTLAPLDPSIADLDVI